MSQRTPEEVAERIEAGIRAQQTWQKHQHQLAVDKLGELFGLLARVQGRYGVNCFLAEHPVPRLGALAGNTSLFSWYCEGETLCGAVPDQVVHRRAKTVTEAFEETVRFLAKRETE